MGGEFCFHYFWANAVKSWNIIKAVKHNQDIWTDDLKQFPKSSRRAIRSADFQIMWHAMECRCWRVDSLNFPEGKHNAGKVLFRI
ncbi:hypothetical protein NPIL_497871 [Nephila pilipes]|uniref:Uncharacterized protein n=1 Tax=Nephila pilipes TaxID=299642 RepID=A0A8X6TE06_NEPPI|nr:hypothetical protein NPIL_497871 [Nephila pilipes]